MKAICADEHVGYVDLLPSFASAGDPHGLWVSPFDAHPNAMANRRAAREILQQFAAIWHHGED